jgi:hypothetical protein
MSGVVNDQYKEKLAGYLVGIGTLPNLTLHLFSAGGTFGDATTSGLTECTGSGYASQSAASGVWTLSTTSGNGIATTAQFTFTFTGALTVQGWWLSDGNNSNAYVAGFTFSTAIGYSAGGGTLLLTVVIDVLD